MSVLSDKDIIELMEKKELLIDNFNSENLTPNGYDLTIDEVVIPSLNKRITEGAVTIPSMMWFAISTKEYVKFSEKITAQLWIRTTWARKGILSSFGKIDAGFEGSLTLCAFNSSNKDVEITIGNSFAQMVLERLHSAPEFLYEQRSGSYQKQKGVRLKKNEPEQ